MLNKLKQYKFSPRTKEEMKNDFAFMDKKEQDTTSPITNNNENNPNTNNIQEQPTIETEKPKEE